MIWKAGWLCMRTLAFLVTLGITLITSGCADLLFSLSDNAREGESYAQFRERQEREKAEWRSTHPEAEIK